MITIEQLQSDFQALSRRVNAMISGNQSEYINFVPSGVNFKLASPQSIDPGHHHTESSLDLSASNFLGYDITHVGSIPRVIKLASTFTKTSDVTMATITGMQWSLVAGKSYVLKAKLIIESSGATGGIQLGLNGTVVTSSQAWSILAIGDDGLVKIITWAASLGGTYTTAGRTLYLVDINGGFTVTTSGTLNIQFAQSVASGFSTVDHDSFAELIEITSTVSSLSPSVSPSKSPSVSPS